MYDHVISLIKMDVAINEIGDPIETPSTEREVFCRISGCTEKDKQMAESRGLRADYTLIFADRDEYDGESWCLIDDALFKIADVRWSDTSNELKVVVSKWIRE